MALIVSKTPLRIPLAGGLSDLKPYVQRFGGVTVSATIQKYIYIFVNRDFDDYINLKYLDVHEKVSNIDHIESDLIREALRMSGLENTPIDIDIMGDLSTDSGLGSSGAVSVGLMNAFHALKGEETDVQTLIQEASEIEVEILEGASGYHDPSICAYGGLKQIEYTPDGISGRDIKMDPATMEWFRNSLLFFYSGIHNKSKPSLHLLINKMNDVLPVMHRIKEIGYELTEAFESGDRGSIARIIGEQQELKQTLPGNFYDQFVEDVTTRARKHGAYAQLPGGKISAFVIVCCPEGQHDRIRKELSDLKEIKLDFESSGSTVTRI